MVDDEKPGTGSTVSKKKTAKKKAAKKKTVAKKKAAKKKTSAKKASKKTTSKAAPQDAGKSAQQQQVKEKLEEMGVMRNDKEAPAATAGQSTGGLNLKIEFIFVALLILFLVVFLAIFGDNQDMTGDGDTTDAGQTVIDTAAKNRADRDAGPVVGNDMPASVGDGDTTSDEATGSDKTNTDPAARAPANPWAMPFDHSNQAGYPPMMQPGYRPQPTAPQVAAPDTGTSDGQPVQAQPSYPAPPQYNPYQRPYNPYMQQPMGPGGYRYPQPYGGWQR